jgi:alpha-glucosidase (family GH31 glycosyl hydrolase)
LRRGLSFGLTTPGLWRAPLGPASGRNSSATHGTGPTPLHVRWAQTALLCPLVGQDLGTGVEVGGGTPPAGLLAAAAVEPYAALRRRLLPYLLHCARETAQFGLPMLRPLLLEFSWDAQAAAIDDQFLLGRDLLVAPVLSASAEPVTRTVHLPQYANWYDWWTGTFYEGGQTIETTAPLGRLPVYVRAGTVIPVGPDAPSMGAGSHVDAAVADVSRLLLFAPHDGAIGASVELAGDDLMGVEQERGERKARIFMEGIPRTVRDIEIVGLPAASVQLVDASAPSIAIVPSDGTLPGAGGTWDSLTIRLDAGAFTAGLELGW